MESGDPASSLISGIDADQEITAPSGLEGVASYSDREGLIPDGAKVGRYTVITQVGSGGMGVVYSAFDPELDRKVALKVMHQNKDSAQTSSGGRERLMREAQAMAKLSHPNVITVHDVGTVDDRVFIAMEFIEGLTLRAWLQSGTHEWSEIVEVFVRAGRGLAAAHAVGLVHRDFKPDNVLIGRGDRVLVMDFGLARQASSTRATESHPLGASAALEIRDPLLTRTGAMVGTPAYMAPEQHKGEATSPLVDQFSFCIALYEALYGQRPFGGNSVASLAINVLEGHIRTPPKSSHVPPWLRTVLMRGLAISPQDRFPSIDALLAELQRDPNPRRPPWVAIAAVIGTTLAVGATYLALRSPPADRCSALKPQLTEIWNPHSRRMVQEAFVTDDAPYSDLSRQSTILRLDQWSDQWQAQWSTLCRQTPRAQPVDLQTIPALRCLEVQRLDFRTLVTRLQRFEPSDRTVIDHAVAATAALPDPARCGQADDELSISDRVPPANRASRTRLAHLHDTLAKARIERWVGNPGQTIELVNPLFASAKALQDPGLEAEVGLELALALAAEQNPSRAERRLRTVVLRSAAGKRPRLEASAWIELVAMVGQGLRQHSESQRMALAAEAAIARIHDPLDLRIQLSAVRGSIALDQGYFDEAQEHLRLTVQLIDDYGPGLELLLADVWLMLGSTLDGLGQFDDAQRAYQQAQGVFELTLGSQHPKVGATLGRLGGAMLGAGVLLQADATLVRARWILDPTHITGDLEVPLPPSMPRWQRRELAAVLDRQGLLQRDRQEIATAELLHRQALTVVERTMGVSHRDLGYPLVNLGLALTEQNRPAEALAPLQRALELWTSQLDPAHPDLGVLHLNLANAHWALNQHITARQHYAEALRLWSETYPEDHPILAYALTGQGRCDLRLGNTASALDALERARMLRTHSDEDSLNNAQTNLLLAQTLWRRGDDLNRAFELVTQARDLMGSLDPNDNASIRRLLAGEPVPRFTPLLVPAGIGAINRSVQGS